MKKIVLITTLLSVIFLSAQVDFSNTRFGITAGPNYARVHNGHAPSGPKYGFYAGILALIPIDNDNQFFFQPEILYVSAGETGRDKNQKTKPGYNAFYGANFISIPINLKIFFSDAESEFFAAGGPRFDFLVKQVVRDPAKPDYEINSYGKAANFNFNVGGVVGYSFKRQLEISLKYDAGISNAFPDLKYSPTEIATGDPAVFRKKSQQVISIGLSYIFQ